MIKKAIYWRLISLQDITDLTVNVDLPDSNITENFQIDGNNIASTYRFQNWIIIILIDF